MKDIIFISGTPGIGKTSIGRMLKEKLKSPYIDLAWLRSYHLDSKWKNANNKEEKMSLSNLRFIIRNYLKNGYKNIVITDLRSKSREKLVKSFSNTNYLIIKLIINDDKELKKRVLTESRDSGWRDYEKSIKLNKTIKERDLLENEVEIDNTHNSPNKTVKEILRHL